MFSISPIDVVAVAWIIMIVTWIASAPAAKKNARRGSWMLGMRLVILLVVFLAIQVKPVRDIFLAAQSSIPVAVQWLGAALCVCGVVLALWARAYLGRNWGMPMSLKQNAELVTTGPYAYVRNPMYTGFILGTFGGMFVIIWWVIPFIFILIYFVWAAKKEEQMLLAEFGQSYADYMKRTKLLIPFIF